VHVDQYDIGLHLLHPSLTVAIDPIPVVAAKLSIQGIDALIGRDILRRCLFVYDGQADTFSLAF